MRERFRRELASLGLPRGAAPDTPAAPVTVADLEPLPEAERRFLLFMDIPGRPRDRSFRIGFTGRFRRKRDGTWAKCEAWQYNSRLPVARIFHIRLRFGGKRTELPVHGRKT